MERIGKNSLWSEGHLRFGGTTKRSVVCNISPGLVKQDNTNKHVRISFETVNLFHTNP